MNAMTGIAAYRYARVQQTVVQRQGDYRRGAQGASIKLKEELAARVTRWEMATALFSAPDQIFGHDEFRNIVRMGGAVVPWIIDELALRPSLLVMALPEITGVDPVRDASLGDLKSMTDDWLSWWQTEGDAA